MSISEFTVSVEQCSASHLLMSFGICYEEPCTAQDTESLDKVFYLKRSAPSWELCLRRMYPYRSRSCASPFSSQSPGLRVPSLKSCLLPRVVSYTYQSSVDIGMLPYNPVVLYFRRTGLPQHSRPRALEGRYFTSIITHSRRSAA